MCVCVCAHLHTCALTVVKTWINGRPSKAAHFSTLCCQMPPTHTHTRKNTPAHTHTSIQLRSVQNRLQPQFNPKKKTALPARSSLKLLKLSSLSHTLPCSLFHCTLHILRRAQLTAAAVCSLLSRSLVFCRTQKAFCLAFLCCFLSHSISLRLFSDFAFAFACCKVCHFFVLFLHFWLLFLCNSCNIRTCE